MSVSATPTASSTFVAADYSTGPDFQGWYLQTTPEPILCAATETYYTSSTYADCYDPSSSAPFPRDAMGLRCSEEMTLVYGHATSYSCASYKIFPTEGSDESEAVLRYGCVINWAADSIYRTLPSRYVSSTSTPTVTDSTSHSASPTTTKPQTTATTTRATTTRATTTNTTSDSQSTTGTASPSSGHGLSGGAIGGIVVGCIAAVATLALFIFRKRIMALFGKGKPASDNQPAWSPIYAPSQTQSMSQSNSTRHASELSSGEQNVHEIGSSRAGRPQVVHELS